MLLTLLLYAEKPVLRSRQPIRTRGQKGVV
jgi:hypothetical protein